MTYVDAFAAAVPTANKERYIAHAQRSSEVFKEHGALQVMECWGAEVPEGEVTSFLRAVQCGDDETVVMGWVIWPSKEVRDAGLPKAMQDERMGMSPESMPFDGKRLIYGGFEAIVQK